jgi:hypothetical protein
MKNDESTALLFRYHRKTRADYGRMTNQPKPKTTKGKTFELHDIWFADDSVFLFETSEQTTKAAGELHAHFTRFGLLMHAGKTMDGKKKGSKTEAMYFPASGTKHDLPLDITFGGFHIPYASQFQYLGSIITNDLSDELEITGRIRRATNQMAGMMNIFKSKVQLKMKKTLYVQIILNTALYGCESWTLNAATEQKLTAFHHKSLRKITNTNMLQVQENRIRNGHMRNALDIDNIVDTVRFRQLNLLGKIARMPETKLQRLLINAWIGTSRPAHRQRRTARHTYADSIQEMMGPEAVGEHALAQEWMPLARDKKEWKTATTGWMEKKRNITRTNDGFNPFLPFIPFLQSEC